ncbi:cellulase family glycosylhydrolase [Cohnella panacarvi]|uniref:cellulase family glycosylhydrolase n=1 Tax=Cohnella panacarvi TaxID=400776 RepID=UPI00047E143E|nr:cellulase family glycosylhydrolase [Cohnella panacarvi]
MSKDVQGFLKAVGRKLVNEAGREVRLRGVGFGSWMLPEGYMWRFPNAGDRPRRIEAMVRELIGEEKAERFWSLYYERYIAETDIARIAQEGFNSVRLPVHWRVLMEEREPVVFKENGFRILDQVIAWCREHRLYVVLDLHGAPGGQTGTNIDDSERDLPELFTDERNRRLTIELWRKLAKRYKDEWIVAGYDLLNEPLPDWFAKYNPLVMPLYRDIIQAIREEDSRHMIILEGAHWATDWTIFDDRPDDNLMLQFHKYWNNPDTESIRKFLDKRDEWNVPIYMGEGGENNKDWYAGAFRLYEDHDISWNFWTWKKMDTDNSPCSIRKPEGWEKLVAYLEGGEKPSPDTAERILWTYLDNLPIEACDYHPAVVNALFRRPSVRIPAIFYGYKGEGDGFGFGGKRETRTIGFRDTDGTDIRFASETEDATPNFQHGGGEPWQEKDWMYVHLEQGDWLAYTFETEKTHSIGVDIRASSTVNGSRLAVTVDGAAIGAAAPSPAVWTTVTLTDARLLTIGHHRIEIKAEAGTVDLMWLQLH